MILDSLNNSERYFAIHPKLKNGFEFLKNYPIAELKEGKHIIDGDRLFAIGMATEGKGKKNAAFETHRKYIDIQYTVSGSDTIGWQETSHCTPENKGYDPEKDVEFYSNRPQYWITVPAGCFAVFFSQDAHAPLGTDEYIHKVVVKVATSWND
jgi:YhcH/YjgK/YiaL family protein